MTVGRMGGKGWKAPLLLLSSWLLNTATAAGDVSACKLPAMQSVYLSAGFGYQGDCVPSNGTLRAFMFFVDFPNAPATEASPQALHDVYLPGAADWYATASQGALTLDVTADTARFVRMPAASTSYGWARGLSAEAHYKYIQDAVEAYLNTSASAIPAGMEVLYIAPTKNAREISFSPTYMSSVSARAGGGQRIARKAVTFGLDAYETWGFKVLNHETGHTMCLPDYYPFEAGRSTGYYVGGWSLMGDINGLAPDWFAWDKWRLGWLPDAAVECVDMGNGTSTSPSPSDMSTTHTLRPLSATGDGTRAVVVARYGQEALVAEMRTETGLDDSLCAAPGVLLYTVSTLVATGDGPVKVLNVNPGSARCAGGQLNDATLSLRGVAGRASAYSVPGWGVKVTVTAQTDDSAMIRIDMS
ncbi:hypothetical protein PG994_008325 [Apiospora phragmitis]|uniref:M6 family metalloprotease domain-containing protein n=1 Tax=Apiospora phragmitis TaxID=2905665 RepID=A0ABR1USP9_9PEZI